MRQITQLIAKLEQLSTGEPIEHKESEIKVIVTYLLLQLFNAKKEDIVFLPEEKIKKHNMHNRLPLISNKILKRKLN